MYASALCLPGKCYLIIANSSQGRFFPIVLSDFEIERTASELKAWSAQIDLLTAKAEHVAAHAKLKYIEEIDALRAKQHVATAKNESVAES